MNLNDRAVQTAIEYYYEQHNAYPPYVEVTEDFLNAMTKRSFTFLVVPEAAWKTFITASSVAALPDTPGVPERIEVVVLPLGDLIARSFCIEAVCNEDQATFAEDMLKGQYEYWSSEMRKKGVSVYTTTFSRVPWRVPTMCVLSLHGVVYGHESIMKTILFQ